MILIDYRTGSVDLAGYLRKMSTVETEILELEAADVAFLGNGPNGTVSIGVEVKKVRDALNSVMDGRFAAKQLPLLRTYYDYSWLLIEGVWGPDWRTGDLMLPSGKTRKVAGFGKRTFTYREFANWLTTMEVKGGVRLLRTASRQETSRAILSLYQWFQKDWMSHKSHLAFDGGAPDAAPLIQPSLVVKIAKELPGIGFTKAYAVGGKFKTVMEMVNATRADWMSIEGIGEGIADRVLRSIRQE